MRQFPSAWCARGGYARLFAPQEIESRTRNISGVRGGYVQLFLPPDLKAEFAIFQTGRGWYVGGTRRYLCAPF
jgi:hypothetical protein